MAAEDYFSDYLIDELDDELASYRTAQHRGYMAETAKGVVKFLEQNKGGFWGFKLQGDNTRYNTGSKNEPAFQNGQLVEFGFYLKNDQYPTIKGPVKVLKSGGAAPSGARTGGGGGGSNAAYWDAKAKRDIEVTEPRITYLAAVERATAIVALAITAGAYPSLEKAKDKLGQIRAYIEAEAQVIFASAYAAKVPAYPTKSEDEGDDEGADDEAQESEGEASEEWEDA